jgi:hypothetical protein
MIQHLLLIVILSLCGIAGFCAGFLARSAIP